MIKFSDIIKTRKILDLFLADDLLLKLHTKDFSEPIGGGYSPITLVPNIWRCDKDKLIHDKHTFIFNDAPSGKKTIYGYFVTSKNGTLLWSEKFSCPFTIGHKVTMARSFPFFFLTYPVKPEPTEISITPIVPL